MNYEFISNLDKAKTFDNAASLEAIKRMYVLCECASAPVQADSCKKYFAEAVSGLKVADGSYIYNQTNGTVRVTLTSNDTALVEASFTGNDELYRTVGTIGINDGLVKAVQMGCAALDDDALMEGWAKDMAKKVGKGLAVGAMALAPTLTGCAGGQNCSTMPENNGKDYIASEYGIDTSKELDGNAIPTLVAEITKKLSEQAAHNEKDDYSVATVPAASEAKHIYDMLNSGELSVPVASLPPKAVHSNEDDEPKEVVQEDPKAAAQHNAATAFARGIRQELHNKLKANGVDQLLQELN